MKYLICFLLIVSACKPKEKEKSNPLVGKWEYQKMERYNGETMHLEDSVINNLHEHQKGLTFTFTNKNVFKVTQRKPNNTEEFVAEQPYELAADKTSVTLKNTGKEDDHFAIIQLTDSILKINVFYSEVAYMVFEKKE